MTDTQIDLKGDYFLHVEDEDLNEGEVRVWLFKTDGRDGNPEPVDQFVLSDE